MDEIRSLGPPPAYPDPGPSNADSSRVHAEEAYQAAAAEVGLEAGGDAAVGSAQPQAQTVDRFAGLDPRNPDHYNTIKSAVLATYTDTEQFNEQTFRAAYQNDRLSNKTKWESYSVLQKLFHTSPTEKAIANAERHTNATPRAVIARNVILHDEGTLGSHTYRGSYAGPLSLSARLTLLRPEGALPRSPFPLPQGGTRDPERVEANRQQRLTEQGDPDLPMYRQADPALPRYRPR